MTEQDDIDAATAELITRNIDLAFRMLGEMVDDAGKIGQVPDGATVFVAPPDDPEVEHVQLQRAMEAAASGKAAYLWRLAVPAGGRSAWQVRALTPRWPTEGIDPVAVYDRATDLLVVDFFRGRRRGDIAFGIRDLGMLSVDSTTLEVVANVLPAFLETMVARDPTMIDVLLRPETELRGISRSDIAQLRSRLRRDAGLGEGEAPVTFAVFTERLRHHAAA
jgi:hypothetical protein